jgi:hypothetical protein
MGAVQNMVTEVYAVTLLKKLLGLAGRNNKELFPIAVNVHDLPSARGEANGESFHYFVN